MHLLLAYTEGLMGATQGIAPRGRRISPKMSAYQDKKKYGKDMAGCWPVQISFESR